MDITKRQSFAYMGLYVVVFAAAAGAWLPRPTAAQGLTGAVIGTVTDEQGAALAGARVRISSPALIGGPQTWTTNDRGQLRFLALPPGSYTLDIELQGFAPYHEEGIRIGVNLTIARTLVLRVAGLEETVVVPGSRIDARDPGFGTRFALEDLRAIPTRRSSMFDPIRSAPGVSPTSPSSGTTTTFSAFGSGTNENQFLIDGTNFTCPCNGIARAEPGVDFIQEVQIQSVGASAEYGNVQGAVINVVTRQGSERFLYDASYYGQTAGLTGRPVLLAIPASVGRESGYGRARYRDFATNLGGPAVRNRLWFFGGYQYLRDYDSQPGTDPELPRTYEQNKTFAKLSWRLAPGWQLVQSLHRESWVNPEQPTVARPFAATLRAHATVPAVTFGHLTHTLSSNTLWDVRVGRFVYSRAEEPSTGNRTMQGRTDPVTGVASGAPSAFGPLTLIRTTGKATLSHYHPGLFGADHQWKTGLQIEQGEHENPSVIPGGVRFVDRNGQLSQAVESAPSNYGGRFITTAGFVSDAVTIGDRVTIDAGLRFDHNRAISQDLHAIDVEGNETDEIVQGLGTLYTWNVFSPRLGVTAKLSTDGRTILRASYGGFSQGVLTGELGQFHPAVMPIITKAYDAVTKTYSIPVMTIDRSSLLLDRDTRAPRTDEYSVGVDREVGRRIAVAVAYVRKNGANFIGWTDVAGRYREDTRSLADGRTVPVFVLDTSVTPTNARRFLLTNQDNYALAYNGLVMAVEKRRSRGWHAYGSYTLSRAYGLQPSGGVAGSAQVSTVAPPPPPQGLMFGRDPNDLTNARGRLPNDRPHMLRATGSLDLPRTGFIVAANVQYFSGKPWAATAQVALPQSPQQRIQLEPRGSERLSSQTLLDVRLSRPLRFGGLGRIELMVDVLNLLNDTAEEGLMTDTLTTETVIRNANFGKPNVFIDPRRAMFSVRMNLGR